MENATETTESGSRRGLRWWQAIIAGLVAAAAANLLVFVVGSAIGASYEYRDSGELGTVGAVDVIFSSTVPLLAGVGVALLLAIWWRPIFRIAQVIGASLALLSVVGPLSLDTDSATQVSLAMMHVVLGAVVILTLEAARRHRPA